VVEGQGAVHRVAVAWTVHGPLELLRNAPTVAVAVVRAGPVPCPTMIVLPIWTADATEYSAP